MMTALTLLPAAALLAAAAPPPISYEMQPLGWVFMLSSVTSVTALVVFCFYRVLTTPRATEHMHAPLDIDTRDAGT